ncbi:MAG: BatA domain-containing protein [Polaribacter sp.]|nr:BatA domain-containing protein [Polaribacter sp.]
MHFKNPEILYLLTLLIIPILVHLFQSQKFVKTPFTNVSFLYKIAQQTRKSSRIKKWLILATRLLLFSSIILTFSQPYISNKKATIKQHNYIYLDNSLSTNTEGKRGNLLQVSAQEIIRHASNEDQYSLLTNSNFYPEKTKNELKKILLNIKNTVKKIDISTVLLKFDTKIKNKTNGLDKIILISDFQNIYKNKFTNVTPQFSAVKLNPSIKDNISIDSVFISDSNTVNYTLNVIVRNQGDAKKNVPVAIYNKSKLISKRSSSFEKNTYKKIEFKIKNQKELKGKITSNFSDAYPFDDTLFFTIKKDQKINVLSIGKNANFLTKIYNNKEFNFLQSTVQHTDYNSIPKQQLIVLNEIENIPKVLIKKLLEFSDNGGSLLIIPNKKSTINSYNDLLKVLGVGRIDALRNNPLKITNINFEHPLFKNVFSKEVTNFQYPTVQSYFPFYSENATNILLFENNTSFIAQIKNKKRAVYWISASLKKNNSNFINSPLVVPIFYNFGKLSFKNSQLFYRLSTKYKIDIETSTKKEQVLTISNAEASFIPPQLKFQNKVRVTTNEELLKSGFYDVLKDNDSIVTLAFNSPKEESSLDFMNLNELKQVSKKGIISESISEVFEETNKKNKVHWLWKWFLTLAIVSLLLEILILKFYKP